MGVPSLDEDKTNTCCLSPKIYQPITEMDSASEFTRKKKMFSSSSFYEEPNAIYPTVEEQVELCRKIADSLSDECNLKSKGANMFFKRVKRAEKWIVAESKENRSQSDNESSIDPLKMPYVRPKTKGLPKLKLLLDPRHILDMEQLQKEGVDFVEHNAISPEVCHHIVKDLNSPTGKGAMLFAKRKKKSVEWVVDEEKVKALLENRYHGGHSSPEPPNEPLSQTRFKPSWLNSPLLHPEDVADSVIKAAEAKIMTYSTIPQIPVIEYLYKTEDTQKKVSFADSPLGPTPFQTSSKPYEKFSRITEIYKYSVPKGWTSKTTDSLPSFSEEMTSKDNEIKRGLSKSASATCIVRSSPIQKGYGFTNFNSTPKAWSSELSQHFHQSYIKPVKPPSLLVQ